MIRFQVAVMSDHWYGVTWVFFFFKNFIIFSKYFRLKSRKSSVSSISQALVSVPKIPRRRLKSQDLGINPKEWSRWRATAATAAPQAGGPRTVQVGADVLKTAAENYIQARSDAQHKRHHKFIEL